MRLSLEKIFQSLPRVIDELSAVGKQSLSFGVSIDKSHSQLSVHCEDIRWLLHEEGSEIVIMFGRTEKRVSATQHTPEYLAQFIVQEIKTQVASRGGAVSIRKPTLQRRDVPVTIIAIDELEQLTARSSSLSIENNEQAQKIKALKRQVIELKNAVFRTKSLLSKSPQRKFKRNV